MSHKLNDPKITGAWTMYDWANSVFSLSITATLFPVYFNGVSKAASISAGTYDAVNNVSYINVFGYNVVNSALYTFCVSISFLLVAFINPILSGIADAKQNKKQFMKFFCYLGSLSCMLLYFFNPSTLWFGILCFILGLFGFGGSIVFYNAFLPEIASEDQFDKLSARGFSLGYVGSVILLLLNLAFIKNVDVFFQVAEKAKELMSADSSLTEVLALEGAKKYYSGIAIKWSFVTVGLWWAGFAQITFRRLPEKTRGEQKPGGLISNGFKEINKVFRELNLPANSIIKRYLIGYFFSAMGVQTVMYVASMFGEKELGMKADKLIMTVLIIQLIAILGAWGFAKISAIIGNIYTLLIMIVAWIGITTAAFYVNTENQFLLLAAVVGSVMGGIQSMSRSTFAKLIPDNTKDTASYFSFYDFCEKMATVLGTLAFALINNYTENMRSSVLALIIFFILALFFIARIQNFKESHP
ncbi:MAG: MFS transporter [Bacteroidia bacterium]|nr:MFS transporter [Bacteroidia bacterium]MCF8427259.1 MFS transporter [Bacteroidia bacterium]MCF8445981.1 MFS transporter [Bacteroidia bacterium]